VLLCARVCVGVVLHLQLYDQGVSTCHCSLDTSLQPHARTLA
jgi:hypothetical protein